MRLIILIITGLILNGCNSDKNHLNNKDIIYSFLKEKLDAGVFNSMGLVPPAPPEGHNDLVKPDSIKKNLVPLIVYVADSLNYDEKFIINIEYPRDFVFIKKAQRKSKKTLDVDFNTLNYNNTVQFKFTGREHFFDSLDILKSQNNYGGLLSFDNLFFSDDGSRAYFEVTYFKGKLNSSKAAIFATFKNGKWTFETLTISIS